MTPTQQRKCFTHEGKFVGQADLHCREKVELRHVFRAEKVQGMQEKRGLHIGDSAESKGDPKVLKGKHFRECADEEKIAEMNR